MLLLRDAETARSLDALVDEHRRHVRLARAGELDELREVQLTKLRRVLDAAGRRAPGDVDESADPWEIVHRLPLTPKTALAAQGHEAFTRPVASFVHYYESSGTTGQPLQAPKALDDLALNTVNIGEAWAELLRPGEDAALILINAPFAPAAYQFEKVLEYLGVMSLRPWVDNITGDYGRLLRLVDELHVTVFVGPPSRLLEMTQFAVEHSLPLPRFRLALLIAEQTGPAFLENLERLTGARPLVGTYGSSETGTSAVTCAHGRLHTQPQSFLLELLDTAGRPLPASAAARGELVVTSLDLVSRPLLRYRTGDLVEIADPAAGAEPCPCGTATPVLTPLGRRQDVVLLDGAGVRQIDLESALWDHELPGPALLNYLMVLRRDRIVLLVTSTGEVDETWTDTVRDRVAAVVPRSVEVRRVHRLPPLASLGQYLGWKLSRVLDLDEPANWSRLPAPLRPLVEQTLREVGHGVAG